MHRLATALLVSAALFGCGGTDTSASGSQSGFDGARAFEDLAAQVKLGPRPDGTRANHRAGKLIKHGLEQAGAEQVRIQRPYRNVLGTIPGSQPGTVIVGAHYDTKSGIPHFVGANDGASGVGVLLELARTLPNPLPGPSVQLVFFDAEESPGDSDFDRKGDRGSRQFVKYARKAKQGATPLRDINAMVLFDMIGDCDLHVPLEQNSDPDLYGLFADAAGGAPFTGRTFPVGDDHTPFLEAGIPAVDFIDFDYGPGPPPGAYWHTRQDTLDKVCPASLDTIGDAALVAIPKIR